MSKRNNLTVHLPGWITGLFPDAIWQIPTGQKVLYLTFDDGPVPGVTPQVLDILRDLNIKATFFCVGENVFKYPDLFQQILDEGHSVGNHTFNHVRGLKCSDAYYYTNIEKANKLIGSNMFRPPHGLMKRSQYRYLVRKYKLIMWDVISCDYNPKLTPEHCFCNVVDFVRDGSIITFHDSEKAKMNVLGALPRVIEHLSKEGYSFQKIEFPKTRPLYSAPWLRQLQKMRENIHKRKKWA
jgi:peptidoglycan/xylan/chitin deacetylase (PgdA/CDA1 family)